MVLLPLYKSPLQAGSCGLFTILEKNNDVGYIMSTAGRQKSKWLWHINMLKPYYNRQDLDGGKPAAIIVSVERMSLYRSQTVMMKVRK